MSSSKSAFDLAKCARPNILALEPYSCARESVCHLVFSSNSAFALVIFNPGLTHN
jgi:hypothetical protein